ncbi:hypothetical protein NGUA25_03895 [Salmonella enterica]|nr:hypothetical protein NGUA25_03895 [Salmonella enterica]
MFVSFGLPAAAQGDKFLAPLLQRARLAAMLTVPLPRPACFRVPAVIAFEILLWIALNPVPLPFGEHQVYVWLLTSVSGGGNVDSPLISVFVAQLLLRPVPDKRLTLFAVQLTRQGDFHLTV